MLTCGDAVEGITGYPQLLKLCKTIADAVAEEVTKQLVLAYIEHLHGAKGIKGVWHRARECIVGYIKKLQAVTGVALRITPGWQGARQVAAGTGEVAKLHVRPNAAQVQPLWRKHTLDRASPQ